MTTQQVPEVNNQDTKKQFTKLALELGPLVVFFFINAKGKDILEAFPVLQQWFTQPIIFATAVFMVAMAISLVLSKIMLGKIAMMPLITGAVVLVFGGATIYFQDSTFIKMKPTITNGLFAAVLLGGLLFGQSMLRYVFGEVYKLQERGWYLMTLRWGLFFVFLAIVNEVVWRNFSDDFWVAFKVWGIMPITMIFTFSQIPLLMRYSIDEAQPAETE